MRRRLDVLLALLVTWGCYGLTVLIVTDREAARCHQFGDLATKCASPFMLFFGKISALFMCATLVLTFFAMRSPSSPDKN
jgi:hypothetical protein